MTALPMRDVGALRDVVRDALAVEIPRKVEGLRAEFGWTDVEMPHAEKVESGEVSDNTLNSMGATWIIVLTPRLITDEQVDIDDRGLPVYMSRYLCRVMVWAKAVDQQTVLHARDRLALAAKLALMEWPNLRPDTYGDTGYRVHRDTYVERFGDPVRLGNAGSRLWAPGLLSIDVDVEETLSASTRPPLGQAETVEQNSYAVGPEQPMTPP